MKEEERKEQDVQQVADSRHRTLVGGKWKARPRESLARMEECLPSVERSIWTVRIFKRYLTQNQLCSLWAFSFHRKATWGWRIFSYPVLSRSLVSIIHRAWSQNTSSLQPLSLVVMFLKIWFKWSSKLALEGKKGYCKMQHGIWGWWVLPGGWQAVHTLPSTGEGQETELWRILFLF